jgi:hypothetical protein
MPPKDLIKPQQKRQNPTLHARAKKKKRGRSLTARQRKFIELKTNFPYPSSAKAARMAGYSESVARKADAIIGVSPLVRRALMAWQRTLDRKWRSFDGHMVTRSDEDARTVLNRLLR